jgi:acyl carrier protein
MIAGKSVLVPDKRLKMHREAIETNIIAIFGQNFEIKNPEPDVDLRETYEFDSIDAIELLGEIEKMLQRELTQEQKKQAMEIRTLNQIFDYVDGLANP